MGIIVMLGILLWFGALGAMIGIMTRMGLRPGAKYKARFGSLQGKFPDKSDYPLPHLDCFEQCMSNLGWNPDKKTQCTSSCGLE
jgi:hypothetical protein